ncbi:MAG: phospho-2-dehydro-3-deoxyheptonate aldolase [Dehalococcoidia bacterium]|nr:phospho-2-dehydro-3-deoxyheptonate aldolase [Dehalococcoidia bacterium]
MPQIHDVNIQRIQPLASPREYLEKLPAPPQIAQLVADGRQQIARILRGEDDRMLLITGPCSLHDVYAGYEYAQRLKELADELQDRLLIVMRVYFEKPRTTVGWKGLVYDPHLNGSFDITAGLHIAREFLLQVGELGVLASTEFIDPIMPQYVADLLSWVAIGARTAESQTHREMASGLSMPVGFKNGTGGSIQLAVDGVVAAQAIQAFLGVDADGKASVVVTRGNPDCHIVLRGGSRGPNYDAASIADAIARLQRAGVRTQLMVDCSHDNSGKDYTKQRVAFSDVIKERVSGNRNIVGLMLESHLHEGNQKIDERNPGNLKYGVSITDPCIGWEETTELLTAAYQALGSPKRTGTRP